MAVIEEVFTNAGRAPSNCNTQPWFAHVVTGDKLEQLRQELPEKFIAGDMAADYPYEGKYQGVYRDRQYASATALYEALSISRENRRINDRLGFLTTIDSLALPPFVSSLCRPNLGYERPAI